MTSDTVLPLKCRMLERAEAVNRETIRTAFQRLATNRSKREFVTSAVTNTSAVHAFPFWWVMEQEAAELGCKLSLEIDIRSEMMKYAVFLSPLQNDPELR